MKGCNYFTESQFTKAELVRLDGMTIDSIISWRNDIHVITSLDPLRIHAIWDIKG